MSKFITMLARNFLTLSLAPAGAGCGNEDGTLGGGCDGGGRAATSFSAAARRAAAASSSSRSRFRMSARWDSFGFFGPGPSGWSFIGLNFAVMRVTGSPST
jgi:hypothetical protein